MWVRKLPSSFLFYSALHEIFKIIFQLPSINIFRTSTIPLVMILLSFPLLKLHFTIRVSRTGKILFPCLFYKSPEFISWVHSLSPNFLSL